MEMVSNYSMLPPPSALEIYDTQQRRSGRASRGPGPFTLAIGLSEKDESVQVATLLTVIGEEARKVFHTLSGWEHEGDDTKI